jgi:hypothetical protein
MQDTIPHEGLHNPKPESMYATHLCNLSAWLCSTLSAGYASSSALLMRMLHTRVLSCKCSESHFFTPCNPSPCQVVPDWCEHPPDKIFS